MYIGVVAEQSELAALSRDTLLMIVAVYSVSVVIAIIFSYIVIYQLMRPLRKLREDIAGQNPQGVHFEQSGLLEIDDIHLALNDMARRLEQSHSRYSFAMEATGEMVGSFEYVEGGGTGFDLGFPSPPVGYPFRASGGGKFYLLRGVGTPFGRYAKD